jgi:hypothetical protein
MSEQLRLSMWDGWSGFPQPKLIALYAKEHASQSRVDGARNECYESLLSKALLSGSRS